MVGADPRQTGRSKDGPVGTKSDESRLTRQSPCQGRYFGKLRPRGRKRCGFAPVARLRTGTADAHEAVELSLGLPEAIRTRGEYVACLARFLRLYRPLEARIATSPVPRELGLNVSVGLHTPRLAADLAALLGSPPVLVDAGADALPDLPSFAHALGALYVLEGATLGGRIILRHLGAAEIDGVDQAHAFFEGRGSDTGSSWRAFRDALDRYGLACPTRFQR
jgi:heme oxygenase